MQMMWFFIVNNINNKELKMVYFTTDKMVACHSSKPNQRSLFSLQRKIIQGVRPNNFGMHKKQCKKVLTKYDLWYESEDNLDRMQ